jgi:beta-L-arabinofuranosidase (glycosyl hydrolase family 127)/glycosyl hydrolase family 127 (putative beta-L-arabinofuranosidase)
MFMAKGLDRRHFLAGGVALGGLAAGSAWFSGSAAAAESGSAATAETSAQRSWTTARVAPRTGGLYGPNAAPLASTSFLRLPPRSVTARGWLATQLGLQRYGLNGRYQDISHFLDYDTTGWINPDQIGWEEVPYWLRGYGDLGYITGDPAVQASAEKWISGILATGQPDGFFGPSSLRTSLNGGPDFWPYLPLMDALRNYQEYSGDARIVPFLTAFMRYMNQQNGSVFSSSWVSYRLATALDSVFWLYNRTGDEWLLTLADTMHANGQNWVGNVPTPHNVNIAEGFREPALYALRSGDASLTQASYDDYEQVMGVYGQFAGGGLAGDENYRNGYIDPRQGFETCGIVEFMGSHEDMLRITGDPVWADRCEELAFNMLPAALDPWGKGVHYITSANSIQLDNVVKTNGQFDDLFAMQAYMPGVDQYRCCPHNYGQGWPYFTEQLWLASPDGGLCASMYAPCTVTAQVANGTEVTITEDTAYPFGDEIVLTVMAQQPVSFPLYLRVPGWCQHPDVRVNGVPASTSPGPSFTVVERTWRRGDKVTITLEQDVAFRTWGGRGGVSVARGPLLYSLEIGEEYTQFAGNSEFPEYEVTPTTPWNYGLVQPSANPRQVKIATRPVSSGVNPFTHEGAPVTLRTSARRLPVWQADAQQVVRTLQPGPTGSAERDEEITLIPMGAARLRITSFPALATGPGAHTWVAPATETASWCFSMDSVEALDDGLDPASSYDQTMPRMTWWPHLGSAEWVQYDYPAPVTAARVAVYWYDDTGYGSCRVPASWQLLYRDDTGAWQPVSGASAYGVARDAYNTTTFSAVTTSGLRLAVQLQPGVSAGILEWRVSA